MNKVDYSPIANSLKEHFFKELKDGDRVLRWSDITNKWRVYSGESIANFREFPDTTQGVKSAVEYFLGRK